MCVGVGGGLEKRVALKMMMALHIAIQIKVYLLHIFSFIFSLKKLKKMFAYITCYVDRKYTLDSSAVHSHSLVRTVFDSC